MLLVVPAVGGGDSESVKLWKCFSLQTCVERVLSNALFGFIKIVEDLLAKNARLRSLELIWVELTFHSN